MRHWLYCHSLSLVLGAAGVVCMILSAVVEHGTWAYDAWMTAGGGFGTTAIFVVASRFLYEKDADPTKRPTRRK